MKKIFIMLGIVMTLSLSALASTSGKESVSNNIGTTKKILVIGLDDNVKSNYFPSSMITEETGIPSDSIGDTYNQAIAENIIASNKNKTIEFVMLDKKNQCSPLLKTLKIDGEEEVMYLNLNSGSRSCFEQLINETDSDYILVLNQHYLKWQEKPLRTLFHITSYSLFDKNRNEITRGNNYFTSMNLESRENLKKVSRKSSSKITSNILKSLK